MSVVTGRVTEVRFKPDVPTRVVILVTAEEARLAIPIVADLTKDTTRVNGHPRTPAEAVAWLMSPDSVPVWVRVWREEEVERMDFLSHPPS